MEGKFALTAIPKLLHEGEERARLEYVTFIATDGSETHHWIATNTGTYAQDFALVVDAGNAQNILTRLHRGETVLFPGLFDLAEIKHTFRGSSNE